MVVVDHKANINRIISVIKNDSNSFDPDTVGKFRAVVFGNPAKRKEESFSTIPYVYVTTKESIQKSTYPYGLTALNTLPQVTVEYKIVAVVKSWKTSEAETAMYDLLKNLRATLEADRSFKDPVANDDPKFTRSVLNQVPWEQDTIGNLIISIDFVLSATIGSIGTIKMTGVNDDNPIEIIAEAPDTEVEGYSPQLNDQLLVKGYAPTGSARTKSIEIDHINAITEELRTLKRTRRPFVLTATDIDGTSENHDAIISQLTSNIARIDNIKTDLIQFLIIP